jgi:hypothetical protein
MMKCLARAPFPATEENARLSSSMPPSDRCPRARCPEERALGETADRRLREIVRGGDLDFSFVACSCRPGTEGTPLCNYGRKCGTLRREAATWVIS